MLYTHHKFQIKSAGEKQATNETDRVRGEANVIMRLQRYHVWEEVPARQCEVLDDQIQTLVCIFDAGDREVADLY
jgi:hypothetical protein